MARRRRPQYGSLFLRRQSLRVRLQHHQLAGKIREDVGGDRRKLPRERAVDEADLGQRCARVECRKTPAAWACSQNCSSARCKIFVMAPAQTAGLASGSCKPPEGPSIMPWGYLLTVGQSEGVGHAHRPWGAITMKPIAEPEAAIG